MKTAWIRQPSLEQPFWRERFYWEDLLTYETADAEVQKLSPL